MGSRFNVLLYEAMHEEGTRLLEEKCDLVYAHSFDEDHLISLARDVDGIIIRANGLVSEAIISAAPRLKVIGRHGAGVDCIDLEAAIKRRIRVVYTPYANTESVAEHFIAMALMLAKKIRLADKALRKGNWQARYELIGTELRGKTLGVLGFGRIGQQIARICHHGFAMPVLYYDLVDYPDLETELGAQRRDIEHVLGRADFVSVNLPLLPTTRGFMSKDLLKLMKPTAFLINMARGPIWKEADVVDALKSGLIAGVGSDVYEVEPASPDNPLFSMDNFVGTPHMSAHTEEGMINMSLVARDVIAVLENRQPEFPVPETMS
ncbi:MAG: hydroxyacid dehydrogenase [Desulfobacteraceae bacterium]|jgi:D-3-phosphoglycerate dehydrogenase